MIQFHLKNSDCAFDEKSGKLVSVRSGGTEMLAETDSLFMLGFRDERNDEQKIFSREFRCQVAPDRDSLRMEFSGHPRYRGIRVAYSVRATEKGLLFRPEVRNIPDSLTLEWIEPLLLSMTDSKGSLFLPQTEGILMDSPLENLEYQEPGWHRYRFYPGYSQMQFLAYFSGKHGLYYAAHDAGNGTKFLDARPENGKVSPMIRNYCGLFPGQDYVPDFDMALVPFEGGWMDACEIHREWMETSTVLPAKGKMPSFVKESPVVAIYPVRGNGDDKGEMSPNEYYPYAKAMPIVRELAKKFDSRILPLLMHWEGTAPWAPPYVWPPLGGEKLLAEYRDALHDEGHFLGVYCSGTAWTQTSSIQKDYSREKQCREEDLEKEMIRGPHDEIDAYICNGPTNQRIGYDMCISQEWPRKTVREEVRKLADFGLDYAQFFDQNLGGASHCCWAKDHRHPPTPGPWQTEKMTSLMAELCAENPGLVLGCESAAAFPYLKYLPFNDLRFACWNIARTRPVPAYAYLFHEYINNFMGNQCGIYWNLELEKCPENLLWRTAYSFSAGDLLSVVLKDHGQIHWGWNYKWERPQPEQESIMTLVRNLNTFRKQHPEFLQYGRMIRPLAAVSGDTWELVTARGSRMLEAFLHSSWRSPDGREVQIVTNFLPRLQTVRITPDSGTEPFDLVLPPLSAVISIRGETSTK